MGQISPFPLFFPFGIGILDAPPSSASTTTLLLLLLSTTNQKQTNNSNNKSSNDFLGEEEADPDAGEERVATPSRID